VLIHRNPVFHKAGVRRAAKPTKRAWKNCLILPTTCFGFARVSDVTSECRQIKFKRRSNSPLVRVDGSKQKFDGDDVFSNAPYVNFNRDDRQLKLNSGNVSNPNPNYGAGSLR